jgi:hypothetical protein
MKHQISYLHCGAPLKASLKNEIDEVISVVELIEWEEEFTFILKDRKLIHQTAYNKRFDVEFGKLGWETQPFLTRQPNLIGDFRKGMVFGEVQFGNSSTLYRDFYKFQYGHQNGLVSLGVLIVPVNPSEFFPTRPNSVANMAEYDLAHRYFTVLPIGVPTMIIGLVASNTETA